MTWRDNLFYRNPVFLVFQMLDVILAVSLNWLRNIFSGYCKDQESLYFTWRLRIFLVTDQQDTNIALMLIISMIFLIPCRLCWQNTNHQLRCFQEINYQSLKMKHYTFLLLQLSVILTVTRGMAIEKSCFHVKEPYHLLITSIFIDFGQLRLLPVVT